jgi:hypothetical protein
MILFYFAPGSAACREMEKEKQRIKTILFPGFGIQILGNLNQVREKFTHQHEWVARAQDRRRMKSGNACRRAAHYDTTNPPPSSPKKREKTRHNRQNLEARRPPRGIWSKPGPSVWLQSAAGDATVVGGAGYELPPPGRCSKGLKCSQYQKYFCEFFPPVCPLPCHFFIL